MLSSLFTIGKKIDLTRLLLDGALVVDVRTPAEFAQGHATGAVNIPLDRLQDGMRTLDKHRPIIACCRSGFRSASATAQLMNEGFTAYNGGTWQNVEKYVPRA